MRSVFCDFGRMSDSIKTMIVDDEPAARLKLRRMLEDFASVDIVGEAESAVSAQEQIERHSPSLVFLDIRLGAESGFDLLPHLDTAVQVVFISAHEEYAVHAFEVRALDYLVKPICPKRLSGCIARFRETAQAETPKQNIETVVVQSLGGENRRIDVGDIFVIQADGDYSHIFTPQEEYVVRRPLKSWPDTFSTLTLWQLSRSMLINPVLLTGISKRANGAYAVRMDGYSPDVDLTYREWLRLRKRVIS